MTTAQVLYSELVHAGVLLERGQDGRLLADDTPALSPFIQSIKEQRDALLEIVAKRDERFYEWVASTCLLSKRVRSPLHRLWLSYEAYCHLQQSRPAWADFERLMRSEFAMASGSAAGIALMMDWRGYRQETG